MLLADRPACTLAYFALFTDLPLLARHSLYILCLRTADACWQAGPALRRRVLSQLPALSLHIRRDPAVPGNLPLFHVQPNVPSSADTVFRLKLSVVPGRVSSSTMDASMDQPKTEWRLSLILRRPAGDYLRTLVHYWISPTGRLMLAHRRTLSWHWFLPDGLRQALSRSLRLRPPLLQR